MAAASALIDELVDANHILFRQGVVDGFGHVSARDPRRSDQFLLARSMAPALVTRADIMRFDEDGSTVRDKRAPYLERFIHAEIYRARPDELKFLFIDPKRVELTLFDGIPHLCHPVVKDVKQAAGILRWALKEMDRRYDLFTNVMTRNGVFTVSLNAPLSTNVSPCRSSGR